MTRIPAPCGTIAAAHRHYYHGEPLDDACREAVNAYARRRRMRSPRDLKPCGTVAAARRHRRRGEPLDEACRQAHNAYARQLWPGRRQIWPQLRCPDCGYLRAKCCCRQAVRNRRR